jgi:hypothetical protein
MEILDNISTSNNAENIKNQSKRNFIILVLGSWGFIIFSMLMLLKVSWLPPELITSFAPWFHSFRFYFAIYFLIIYLNYHSTFRNEIYYSGWYHLIVIPPPLFFVTIMSIWLQEKGDYTIIFPLMVILFIYCIFSIFYSAFLHLILQITSPIRPPYIFFVILFSASIHPILFPLGCIISIGGFLGYYLMKKMSYNGNS